MSKAVVLDVSEISCSYSKPAGRLSNSWCGRGRNCNGTWSDMNVSSIRAESSRGQNFGSKSRSKMRSCDIMVD